MYYFRQALHAPSRLFNSAANAIDLSVAQRRDSTNPISTSSDPKYYGTPLGSRVALTEYNNNYEKWASEIGNFDGRQAVPLKHKNAVLVSYGACNPVEPAVLEVLAKAK